MANIRRMTMVIALTAIFFALPAACVRLSGPASSKYFGVGRRRDSNRYHCEMRVPEWGIKKLWGGTYETEEQAARACDVISYYTNRDSQYNFPDSRNYIEQGFVLRTKLYTDYDLQNPLHIDHLAKFIKLQASSLVLLTSRSTPHDLNEEAADVPRTDGMSERVGDGTPTPPDTGLLHHAPEPSFSQDEWNLFGELFRERPVGDALSTTRPQLSNGEGHELHTAAHIEDLELWVDSLFSEPDPLEGVNAEMEKNLFKDGCNSLAPSCKKDDFSTGKVFDDHTRDCPEVFSSVSSLICVSKSIASLLHSLQLTDIPSVWYSTLAKLVVVVVRVLVKIKSPSDADKEDNSGVPENTTVHNSHAGGKRLRRALPNLKGKCSETVVVNVVEPHPTAADGIESIMACKLEVLTLLTLFDHRKVLAARVLCELSSVHEEKRLLIAELAIPRLIESLEDSNLLVRSYVATTLCNLVSASNCNLFDKDDANSPFKTPGAIAGIIGLLRSGDIIAGKRSAAELLWRLSQNFVNIALIGECDAIPTLIDSLLENRNGIRQYCLGTLCNLSQSPKYRISIRNHEPVTALKIIIGSGCSEEIADAREIIWSLIGSRGCDGLNEAMWELTATLIDSVEHGDQKGEYKGIAVEFLRWLCEDMSAEVDSKIIVESVVPFLFRILQNGNNSGKASAARCLWLLRTGSQTLSTRIQEHGAFPLLISVLFEVGIATGKMNEEIIELFCHLLPE